jgi:hypothetical protein
MVVVGLATVGPLAIFTIHKIYRITNSFKRLILYSLFVLLPPTVTIVLILLCGRTLTEAARLPGVCGKFPGRGCGMLPVVTTFRSPRQICLGAVSPVEKRSGVADPVPLFHCPSKR